MLSRFLGVRTAGEPEGFWERLVSSPATFRWTWGVTYLDDAFEERPFLDGTGTGWPASTEDCNDVGGSMAGWGVGWEAGAAKSRAAVPGCGPMKPSLTAVVLALSSGGRVECGTDSEALPVPRDALSATRLRADLAFTFSLSMGALRRRKSIEHQES